MVKGLGSPVGTLQVDVDDLWVYYESIGHATPKDAPTPAFTEGVPRLLDLFDRYGARATFFVCGRDLPSQTQGVREIVRRGHEVANHSAGHRNGYARLALGALREDVREAHERICDATGVAPVGFKAPGFSYNPALPEVLSELGYLYDSSILPTWWAPAIRFAQRLLSQGEVDPTHYGRARYGFRPLHPHPLGGITEAPVTTMPVFRLPIHSTFVLTAGRWLFDLGLGLARMQRTPINYLLHAGDVVDPVQDPKLASYRFLTQTWAEKRPIYDHMLEQLSRHYPLLCTRDFIDTVRRD